MILYAYLYSKCVNMLLLHKNSSTFICDFGAQRVKTQLGKLNLWIQDTQDRLIKVPKHFFVESSPDYVQIIKYK